MLETFDTGVIPALSLAGTLLHELDEQVYKEVQPMGNLTFIVSWILTWFSHDLENLDNVA